MGFWIWSLEQEAVRLRGIAGRHDRISSRDHLSSKAQHALWFSLGRPQSILWSSSRRASGMISQPRKTARGALYRPHGGRRYRGVLSPSHSLYDIMVWAQHAGEQ
jgi:hypothetical protein